jgi:hypothetical protein
MTVATRPRAWIVVALLSTCLAACTTTEASVPKEPPYKVAQGGTYVPEPTAELEYALEASTLQLPAAHTWPQHPMPKPASGTPEWYQLGYAKQAADRFWFCSWAAVATSTTDPKTRHDAVLRLQDITKLYYYTHALDAPSQPLLLNELKAALRGDLSAVRTDLKQNC